MSTSTVTRAQAIAQQYPRLRCTSTETSLSVEPGGDRGFDVVLEDHGSEIVLRFDAGHWHFEDREEALELFEMALSGRCRLKVTRGLGVPYKWTVEVLTPENEWAGAYVTALIWPFFFPRRVTYLRNEPP